VFKWRINIIVIVAFELGQTALWVFETIILVLLLLVQFVPTIVDSRTSAVINLHKLVVVVAKRLCHVHTIVSFEQTTLHGGLLLLLLLLVGVRIRWWLKQTQTQIYFDFRLFLVSHILVFRIRNKSVFHIVHIILSVIVLGIEIFLMSIRYDCHLFTVDFVLSDNIYNVFVVVPLIAIESIGVCFEDWPVLFTRITIFIFLIILITDWLRVRSRI